MALLDLDVALGKDSHIAIHKECTKLAELKLGP
jgi:hypothetical protein